MRYLTLDEAKHHLYVDDNHDDQIITFYILAAEAVVDGYINKSPYVVDVDGEQQVNHLVKAATAIMTGILYKERDTTVFEGVEFGKLPFTVTALLSPLRTPVIY